MNAKINFNIFILFFISFFLLSCLQERGQKTQTSTSSWFNGLSKVQNLGGSPASIKINWNSSDLPVSAYRLYYLQFNPDSKKNEWQVLDEVSSETTSYVASDLISGQIYSFMVRAVNLDEVEDTNEKQLSTVAFEGISAVNVTGQKTATVMLNSPTGAFDEIRVYAQPQRPGAGKQLVKKVKGNVTSIDLDNLQSGTKYKFMINAYMSYLSAEDGNEISFEGKTYSESFGSGQTNDKNFAYRGVLAVQSFGLAPNAPTAPTVRTIRLTWPGFAGSNSNTAYRVIRSSALNTPNVATIKICSNSVSESCIVQCNPVGSGAQTCEDTDLAAPPMTYLYVITLLKTDPITNDTWAEELPKVNASDYYVKIPVAPSYMVTVHRDAANYDMCRMLNSVSDPRKNQRCLYSGIAATPYNSGPGKPALSFDNGFYDFGYNLFVDRFRTACNWTRNSASCGPNGCIGETSSGAPDNALGVPGDVYFALAGSWGPSCYYKRVSGWTHVNNLNLTEWAEVSTNDPGPIGLRHKPQINGLSQDTGFTACQSQSTEYGRKRVMRKRELIHAQAFPTLPGEPNAILDPADEYVLRNGSYDTVNLIGGQNPGYYRCAHGTSTYMLPMPTDVNALLSPINYRSRAVISFNPFYSNGDNAQYFIGTIATSKCVSRWGSQDPISSHYGAGTNTVLSDTFIRTNLPTEFPPTYAPVTSDIDSGVLYDWGNYLLDGVTSGPAFGIDDGVGRNNLWITHNNTNLIPRYILPMGLGVFKETYGNYKSTLELIQNGTLGASTFNYQNTSNFLISNWFGTSVKYFLVEGEKSRFSYTIRASGGSNHNKVWCALEAE